MRDIFFLDEDRGWMVGGGYGVSGGIIGTTEDGGRTWSFRSQIVAKPSSRLFHLNAVHFIDREHGVIAADGGRILYTQDGGGHWHSLLRAGRQFTALQFLDANEGWAAGGGWVMRTLDGGQTWTRRNLPEARDSGFRAYDVKFADADHGWLAGASGSLRRTQDGGRSWLAPESGVDALVESFRALFFLDRETGWVVGDGGVILGTQDGGRVWMRRSIESRCDWKDIEFLDSQRGWLVGFDASANRSEIWRTRDAGESWTLAKRLDGEALTTLHVAPSGRVLAVGHRIEHGSQRLLRYVPATDS